MADLAYETLRQVTPQAGVVLANNPSPYTITGTNTWLLRAPGTDCAIIIDPGPDDLDHLRAVIDASGRVAEILLTHGHIDHSAGARRLHELTGATVRALDPQHRFGAEGLTQGDVVAACGVELRVLATPGHSSDSLSFVLTPDPREPDAVLTGDTILGLGTTVVAHPDGNLADYLASLHRLAALGDATVLPGHGPELASVGDVAERYLEHRRRRLDEVKAVLAEHGPSVGAHRIVEIVYANSPTNVRPLALLSVKAQLAYLGLPTE